ncbi:MAG: hypothetical protein GW859_06585 [Sphingomonadales bacterium]|nr:hypothetical protein [Sphingomonadales bacterium]
MTQDRQEMVRRLQMGGLGLFAVLLMVSLAGLVGDRGDREGVVNVADPATGADMPASNEPLAELGVQPALNTAGDEDAEVNPVPTVQQPARAPQVVPDLRPDPELEKARRARQ